ncbi:MAG: hypothetical protein L6R38_001131 [Xanthoria sp. 2 TBL-2021]|nr:MAG: hypothetical protein L6R38_001131 [Xanthoria sp. 2 TBL-2021]
MLLRWLVPWLLFFSLSVQAFPTKKTTPIRERNDAEDDDPCRDYADCSSKGFILWNTLHTTLFKDQITDRNDRSLFQKHYISEFSHFDLPDKKFHLPLRNRGIEIVKMDYWAIYPKNPDTQENERPDDPPYLNMFDTKNGILIADANFRAEDTQKALNWSELMYQTWALANVTRGVGGPISNLRSIVRSEVVNEGTKAAFEVAYQNNLLRPGGDGPEDWREWNEATHGSFFLDMLATDNIKGVVWLLNDHAAEMGRKEITSIYSRWTRDIAPAKQMSLPIGLSKREERIHSKQNRATKSI